MMESDIKMVVDAKGVVHRLTLYDDTSPDYGEAVLIGETYCLLRVCLAHFLAVSAPAITCLFCIDDSPHSHLAG